MVQCSRGMTCANGVCGANGVWNGVVRSHFVVYPSFQQVISSQAPSITGLKQTGTRRRIVSLSDQISDVFGQHPMLEGFADMWQSQSHSWRESGSTARERHGALARATTLTVYWSIIPSRYKRISLPSHVPRCFFVLHAVCLT